MTSRPELPHSQVVAYIRGECDSSVLAGIAEVRANNFAYDLLFKLIDENRTDAGIASSSVAETPATFAAVEALLAKMLSGNFGEEEKGQLFGGLVASASFYQRLLAKLRQAAPRTVLDEVPELAQIRMKTPKELLQHVVHHVAPKSLPPHSFVDAAILAFEYEKPAPLKSLRRTPGLLLQNRFTLPAVFALFLGVLPAVIEPGGGLYDHTVPYQPESGLRSFSPEVPRDSLRATFAANFSQGFNDYMVCDYKNAVAAFERMEGIVAAMQTRQSETTREDMSLLHDYYFYRGATHYALSRSRQFKLKAAERKQHANEAIHFLKNAQVVAASHGLNGHDRDSYFLGQAYGFAGHREAALVELYNVRPESKFYHAAERLIQQWRERNVQIKDFIGKGVVT